MCADDKEKAKIQIRRMHTECGKGVKLGTHSRPDWEDYSFISEDITEKSG